MSTNTFYKVLKPRQLCDTELLLNGGFAPLQGFLNQADYHSVLNRMRLSTGDLWPIPVNLAFSAAEVAQVKQADRVVLTMEDGLELAELEVADIYEPDLHREALLTFGADDANHPFVQILHARQGMYYIGGRLKKRHDVPHRRFPAIRHSPAELKRIFQALGWDRIVAFQTRNPMHKSHYHLTLKALEEAGPDANLLIHPVVGVTQAVDIHYDLRVRCYQKLLKQYPEGRVFLSLLPLSMRMAGPREAVWHALIRRNYGATHFVIGRDHAGPSYKKQDGSDFYGPYEAQDLLLQHADEIGIQVIRSRRIAYVEDVQQYLTDDEIQPHHKVLNISGTQQRELLRSGKPLHDWFTFPDIRDELEREFREQAA
ncbi:MAG TPA: sulfate adenylyltransferase [Thiolinea sp.]|nr:sulfate adenylyltransferase [Thiolinea sp.]